MNAYPAVIIRKNRYGNRSQRGADCQAVLMSIFRTLKQRGHDPVTTICTAIATSFKRLKCYDFRFTAALETIVLSRQFREIRGHNFATTTVDSERRLRISNTKQRPMTASRASPQATSTTTTRIARGPFMATNRLALRTLLRGLGASMTLPWLESLSVWGDDSPHHPDDGERSDIPSHFASDRSLTLSFSPGWFGAENWGVNAGAVFV